ncbi:MAG: 3-deoxy-D-manno-octulosonic acid transferase [Paludibacteraceae bacterium]|nr:3-deoxy-D-manno-octulosonic acid transferase [Paludibacteraceae bacterium]
MRLIYDLGIQLYSGGAWIASFFDDKAKKFVEGRKNVFQTLSDKIDPQSKYVWIHAASLGEFEQGRPIIEKLKVIKPEYKIILTFFSPSGYEVRKNYEGADIVCYLPMDTSWNAKRFLSIVRPSYAIFIKYEFWKNYLSCLKEQNIPTYIVSAIFRPSQAFFKWYGGWYRSVLKNFTHLFVQNKESKELLSSIGVTNVSLAGDTRFDRVKDIAERAKQLPIVESFVGDSKVFIAGSSWPKDEAILIPYINEHPELKFIIAPHEIHEEHISKILSMMKRPCVRYTQTNEEDVKNADCLIVDCFGLLSSIYRYGQVAYIGGGFGVGIHNILEAAVYGIPVMFGPNYKKFKEAVDMVDRGGAYSISNETEFARLMDDFYSYNSILYHKTAQVAAAYSDENKGATEKVILKIFEVNL